MLPRYILDAFTGSETVKAEDLSDRQGLYGEDPGPDRAVRHAMDWLCLAQDRSASGDGGVARHYSLRTGWARSYPETTGYIILTMLAFARRSADPSKRERARRMLDWLVSIQMPEGAFQGGIPGIHKPQPVVFNTGQILLGLAAGVKEFGGDYRQALFRAADWLVQVQDRDGCWRKHGSPLVIPGEKTYDTHASWGLLETARIAPGRGYAEAALANVQWAVSQQHPNGWFSNCCLSDPVRPLTHTIGYALRGVLEAYRFTGDDAFLAASERTADGLLSALRSDGWLPGRLDRLWQGSASWVCLTGTAQVAACWLHLYEVTRNERYRDAAFLANRFVRRTLKISGPEPTVGGIKGSFPAWGPYGAHEFLSWACKFFIDANMLEQEIPLL